MPQSSSGFFWLIFPLCVSLIVGLPGCSHHDTTIASHLNFLVKDEKLNRKNIGLVGGSPILVGEVSLSDVSDPTAKKGMMPLMLQGAWEGALSGLESGQLFCWGGSRYGGKTMYFSGYSGRADALVFLILCTGGMVAGVSIGATVGLLAPLVIIDDPPDILIGRQHVIGGIWKELVTTDAVKGTALVNGSSNPSVSTSSHGSIGFGRTMEPYTSFLKPERIHVGLFPESSIDASGLTLVWKIQLSFLDHRRQEVARQSIEMEQGEYPFDQWADEDARLLKEKLNEGYRRIAEQIIKKLSENS